MDNENFIKEAKNRLFNYLYPNKQNQKANVENMFVTWLSKAGGNNKCLIGLTDSNDYFEITYIGNENTFVLDHYMLKNHKYI